MHNRWYNVLTGLIACFSCNIATGVTIASEYETNQFLDMDLAQLMEITITSVAKKPQTLSDAAAAIYVITQEDIRRSGVTSIPDALTMAPGIQVAKISSNKWSISSRGFGGYTSNKLLVLIDGRSVYTPAYSGTFWDMQHTMLEDIDRIEIIRGPGGTLWGANAVNGVINIITKKAQDTQGTLIRAGIGDQEKLTGAARYGRKISDSAFGRLYISGNKREDNILEDNQQSAFDGWHNLEGGFRFDGSVGEKSEWTFQGDLFTTDGDQIVFPFWVETPPYMVADYGSVSSNGGNLNGSWQHGFSNGDKISLKGYYDYNDRKESYYEQTFRTLDFEAQYETTIGSRNALTTGAGYRYVDGEFVGSHQIYIPNQTTNLYSAFLQDEIKLIDERLWLTVGIKYEHNDFTGNEWQPSARLLWKPQDGHSLWTSVARAVRTPSMVENSGKVTIASIPTPFGLQKLELQGNDAFGSEELIAYEAGYRWQVSQHMFLDLAAYYNDYDDIYGTVPNMDIMNPGLLFSNEYEGKGYGVELAANWQATSWMSYALTYSYQKLDLDLIKPSGPDSVFGSNVTSIYEVNTPRHQAGIRSSIDLTDNLEFNWWLKYTDAIKGIENRAFSAFVPVPSYFTLDVNLIWKPMENMEVMLAVNNLLNDSQLQYIAELITPPTEIERSIYGKITWSF